MKTKLNEVRTDAVAKHRHSCPCRVAPLTLAILALAGMFVIPAQGQTNHATIPFDQIGAVAGKKYSGDALAVASTPDGARLRCAFQRLNARVTAEGLWLASTADVAGGEPFRVIARTLGREGAEALLEAGEVELSGQVARFIRPGLTEEYSVSVDGVRQDFVIDQRPAGTGSVRVELEVNGAKAEAITEGVRLSLVDGGRKLIYNRLKAQDARGRELKARMEVVSASRIAVVLEDADAEYPVRIDPTFSDANWISLCGLPGVDDGVRAAVVDGAGNLYIGGTFFAAGNVLANGVAKWDGNSWSALGTGVSGQFGPVVQALAVSGGIVYVGGTFTTAGGVAATNIAQWNGTTWSALGSGVNGGVRTLAALGSTLYVGGYFTSAGGASATGIAQWNGSAWSDVGGGVSGGYGQVTALAVSGSTLYVGGYFNAAGGASATNIARWDGSSWSALGSGLSGGTEVSSLLVSGNTLYAGGQFTTAGDVSVNNIAQWNGSSWSALGSGITASGYVRVGALAMMGTNLYALGYFDVAGGVPASHIAQWDGSSWSALDSGLKIGAVGNTGLAALAVSGNSLYVGAQFVQAGGVRVNNLARWNGSTWSAVGSQSFVASDTAEIHALTVLGDTLYAAGWFTNVAGIPANNIAQWNGSAWSAVGSGITGAGSNGYGPFVFALAASSNTLYAGGNFSTAGGVPANCLAQWDGSSWSAVGSGISGVGANGHGPTVSALAVSGNDLYVGGNFTMAGGAAANYIARWNGASWSSLGSGMNEGVGSIAVYSNTVYAGGGFTMAGGVPANYVAQWNGSSWSPLGAGMDSGIGRLAVLGNKLYAAGNFTTAGGVSVNHIAQWDGSSWSPLGSGLVTVDPFFTYAYVYALAASDNALYAAGFFNRAGGVPVNNIAQWNGNSWSALGSGISGKGGNYANATVRVLAVSGDNNLYAGGGFSAAGTNGSPFVAEALFSQASHDLALTKLGAGTNVITGLGTPGYSYALDLATNLAPPINWLPQATNTLPDVHLIFTNVNVFPQGIYRTRYVPQ